MKVIIYVSDTSDPRLRRRSIFVSMLVITQTHLCRFFIPLNDLEFDICLRTYDAELELLSRLTGQSQVSAAYKSCALNELMY